VSDWTEGFFGGLWQEAQLRMWTDEANRAAADKIERALQLRPGWKVLDVPCGDGRISIELAARGYEVVGVDITDRFLGEARRKADERGLTIRFETSDMRGLTFEAEFDAAFNFGGSFGYFDEEGNTKVVEAMGRALRPGGRFLIDTPTPETIFPRFRERRWSFAGDVLLLTENRYDHQTGRIDGEWTIVSPDGHRETRHSSIRLYAFRELSALLRDAGFEQIEGFDADTLESFGFGASRLILVATKAD